MAPSLRSGKSKQAAPKQTQPSKKRPKASTTQDKGVGGLQGGAPGGRSKSAPPPKKKVKTGSKASESSTQRDVFSTLPLDVLRQICRDVDPGTLLAISGVSKLVHCTIASKSAAKLWTFVRDNAGLPDLSEPPPEPKYAHLAQGYVCQACGTSSRVTGVEHPLRVRACSRCFTANLKSADNIRKEHQHIHPLTFDFALSSPYSAAGHERADGKPYYWLPDVLALSTHLHSLDPVAALAADGAHTPSEAAVAYSDERILYVKRVNEDAETMLAFERGNLKELQNKQQADFAKRFQQLRARVTTAGYTDREGAAIPRCARNSTAPLTDQEWTKIGPMVLARVAQYHDQLIAWEKADARYRRRFHLKPLYDQLVAAAPRAEQALWPRFEAFYELPSVRVLWQPENAIVDPADCHALRPTILAEVQREMRIDKLYCFDIVARGLGAAGAQLGHEVNAALDGEPSIFLDARDESRGLAPLHAHLSNTVIDGVLDRATAVLECTSCSIHLSYAEMLAHLKDHHSRYPYGSCEAPMVDFVKLLRDCLVEAGKDEATTKASDLRDLGAVFDVGVKGGRVSRGRTWDQVTSGAISLSYDWPSRRIEWFTDDRFISIKVDATKVRQVEQERRDKVEAQAAAE